MVTKAYLNNLIRAAIKEDIGKRDITTYYAISPSAKITAEIIAEEDLILCGLDVCKLVFKRIDKRVKFKALKKDGQRIRKGAVIARIYAPAQAVLKAERIGLNFLTHLSGVASGVREYVDIAKKYKVKILDTRKTLPGLRPLQKYAVRCGGGVNHRWGLWDAVMIKENHIISAGLKRGRDICSLSLGRTVKNIKKATGKTVEVEVENLKEFKCACACRPDIILLDNFTPKNVKKAVAFRNKYHPSIKLEASGGMGIKNVAQFARTGVDYISVGSLTHSSRAKDISLEIV
jgi:nicotinate-nucleotide pyrophosphorylase (carboxylating)